MTGFVLRKTVPPKCDLLLISFTTVRTDLHTDTEFLWPILISHNPNNVTTLTENQVALEEIWVIGCGFLRPVSRRKVLRQRLLVAVWSIVLTI